MDEDAEVSNGDSASCEVFKIDFRAFVESMKARRDQQKAAGSYHRR